MHYIYRIYYNSVLKCFFFLWWFGLQNVYTGQSMLLALIRILHCNCYNWENKRIIINETQMFVNIWHESNYMLNKDLIKIIKEKIYVFI